jgi:hypothetical protein
MMALPEVRYLLCEEVVVSYAIAFLPGIVCGILVTTFALYCAGSLGALLTLTGVLVKFTGITCGLPKTRVGLFCDGNGRRRVISEGLLQITLSSLSHMVPPSAYLSQTLGPGCAWHSLRLLCGACAPWRHCC